MTEQELATIAARLGALRLGVRFDLRDQRQLGRLRDAHLLQALDDGDALVAEVRRLQATAEDCPLIHIHCGQEPDYE